MAFCANCGAEVQGRFCAKCGSPAANPPTGAGSGTGGPAPAMGAPGTMPPPPSYSTAQSGLADNMASALCYLLGVLTGVLFLVLEPYNRNRTIRFHAFQSIFIWVAWIVAMIVLSVISAIFREIPYLGAMINTLLYLGLSLGMLVLWLLLMYKAYNNERWVLPVIGPLAEKQA
jgi:uncharacterized membrane protein